MALMKVPATGPELNHQEVHTAPRPAASVVLLRDAPEGLEAFLLERPEKAEVMGGVWVFPGGKVDPEDHRSPDTMDGEITLDCTRNFHRRLACEVVDLAQAAAFMRAALRETEEESSVQLAIHAIEGWSRWVTPRVPSMMTRRFDTLFFAAVLPQGQEARHDGQESVQGIWSRPILALERYWRREILLAPPQIMTLIELSRFDSASGAMRHAASRPLPHIQPEPLLDSEGMRVVAYPGDPEHPLQLRQIPGPSRLVWRSGRFEPPCGRFEGFFA